MIRNFQEAVLIRFLLIRAIGKIELREGARNLDVWLSDALLYNPGRKAKYRSKM